MEEAVLPQEPAENSAKMLAVGGFTGGGMLATMLVFGFGAMNGRLRYSEDLWKVDYLVPILGAVTSKSIRLQDEYAHAINKLRNRIKLVPARAPKPTDRGRILAVGRLDRGDNVMLPEHLAVSFAATRLRVLLVDADMVNSRITKERGLEGQPGWSNLLTEADADCIEQDGIWVLPSGNLTELGDADIGLYDINAVLTDLAREWDVVIVHFGSLADAVSSELILTATDFCLAQVTRGDRLRELQANSKLADRLPRNGGGLWLEKMRRKDSCFAS